MYWDVHRRKCCDQCFQFPWLREYIVERSTQTGACRYCGAADGKLIEISELSEYFANLLTMYLASDSDCGDPLVYLMQDDWAIFDDELFDSGDAASLVEGIMMATWDDDSGESPLDAHELYVRAHPLDYVERFEAFLDESRETVDAEPDFPEILRDDIWRYGEKVLAGRTLYRARLGWGGERDGRKIPWQGTDIGAR
jgi:hypothetical protein